MTLWSLIASSRYGIPRDSRFTLHTACPGWNQLSLQGAPVSISAWRKLTAIGLATGLRSFCMKQTDGHIPKIPHEFILRLSIQIQDFRAFRFCYIWSPFLHAKNMSFQRLQRMFWKAFTHLFYLILHNNLNNNPNTTTYIITENINKLFGCALPTLSPFLHLSYLYIVKGTPNPWVHSNLV